MPEEAVAYLTQERVGVLAVQMPDGTPHAATVHFAYTGSAVAILTDRDSRKVEALAAQPSTRASFVIGFREGKDAKTLQMDGTVAAATGPIAAYFEKFPEKREFEKDHDVLFLTFTPSWWRFTDYTAGKHVLVSDERA